MKNLIVAIAALAVLVGTSYAGTNCHGTKKTKAAPAATTVDQSVTVAPGVLVTESVEIDAPGGVTVKELVSIGSPAKDAPAGGAGSVRSAKKNGRKVKKAMEAEAKAERKAARAASKAANAAGEAAAEAATANAFFR
jgi:hypothetical protein